MAERVVGGSKKMLHVFELECPVCKRKIRANGYALSHLRRFFCRCGAVCGLDVGKDEPELFELPETKNAMKIAPCSQCYGCGAFAALWPDLSGEWHTRLYICPCGDGERMRQRIVRAQMAAAASYRREMEKQTSERGKAMKAATIEKLMDQRRKVQAAVVPPAWGDVHGEIGPPDEDEQLALWRMSRGEDVPPELKPRLAELIAAMQSLKIEAPPLDAGTKEILEDEGIDVAGYGAQSPPRTMQDDLDLREGQ